MFSSFTSEERMVEKLFKIWNLFCEKNAYINRKVRYVDTH